MSRDGALRRAVPAALLVGACGVALAAGVGTEAQERTRIGVERAEAQSAFVSRERHCQNSFVVTPCVEQARRDLREVLLRLRRQEAVLDEMLRRERAAERMETIRSRPAAPEAEASEAPSRAPRNTLRDAPQMRAHEPSKPKASAVERERAESLNRQKFEAASQAARDRKAVVERRNAERAASGNQAAPLPVPFAPGASAP